MPPSTSTSCSKDRGGLIFLKYISDAFEERHAAVVADWGEDAAEDRDEYIAENIFWVPREARWTHLKAQARQPTIGQEELQL